MNIEAKNLSKIYGDGENRVVALDHANLEIVSSDFISIMGPSGSGKSTLLHLLSGLDKPSSGSLTYDGKDIYSYSDKELSAFRRKRIGFIFQQFNLLPVLTAKENIIMPLLLDKQKPDEAYLKQLTELLGIQGRLEHLPHELSGGQQQRVAIARALIAKPDVIFADEPTGNLDSKSGGEVMELLQNVWKKMGIYSFEPQGGVISNPSRKCIPQLHIESNTGMILFPKAVSEYKVLGGFSGITSL